MSSASEPEMRSAAASSKQYLILIVDDSEEDRFTFRQALQTAQVPADSIIECNCGEAALDLCRSRIPDLIVLEYSLPDIDGLELMQELTAQLGTCPPVVMLTGRGSEQIAVDAMKGGAKDYLIKGKLTPERLVQTVANVLTERKLRVRVQRQQQQRKLLSEVAIQVSRATELEQTLQAAAEGARRLLECDRTIMYQFEADMSGIVMAEAVLPEWTATIDCAFEDNCFQGKQGYQADKYRQGHKMVVPDITAAGLSECHVKMLQGLQVKANLVVPILGDRAKTPPQLWGLLIAQHCKTTHDWQPDELALLDELSVQVAIAIQQAELVSSLTAGLKKQRAIDAQLRERATQLERANQLLANAMSSLNQRNQELDAFAYIVSHDLKAPLRGISNLSEWLIEDLQDQIPAENCQQLGLIQTRVFRMEAMIDGVLQYSRAGKQAIEKRSVDLRVLLQEVIDSLTPPKTFQFQLPETLPCIEVQALLLEQVFTNLISNAIKYHDRPDGRIQIACEDQGKHLQFSVIDDGPGIDPEHHQSIFDIFQTLSTAEQAKGTGIGLTIIKKIIEQQGGTIWVDSERDKGSAFSFTWPYSRA
ncbi:MAG: ATP-binding protein [Thermosynechococcaceae cyanobacterium]